MSSTGHIRHGNAAASQVLRSSFLVEAVMQYRHEFVFHSLRHVEPMKVVMHNLRQTTLNIVSKCRFSFLVSVVTDKTCSCIQETL